MMPDSERALGGAGQGLMLLLAALLSGCGFIGGGDEGLDVPRNDDGIETWDLRDPPAAEELGLERSIDEVILSTDEPRPVRVLLPEGMVLEADLTTVSFDNHRGGAGDRVPSGMDLHSSAMDFDEARQRLGSSFGQLGIDPGGIIEQWQADVDAMPDGGGIGEGETVGASGSRQLGYLRISVGGRYSPPADAATLSWTAVWEPQVEGTELADAGRLP